MLSRHLPLVKEAPRNGHSASQGSQGTGLSVSKPKALAPVTREVIDSGSTGVGRTFFGTGFLKQLALCINLDCETETMGSNMTDKARQAHGKTCLADILSSCMLFSFLPGDKQLPEPGTTFMQWASDRSVSDFRSNESPSSHLINSTPMDQRIKHPTRLRTISIPKAANSSPLA